MSRSERLPGLQPVARGTAWLLRMAGNVSPILIFPSYSHIDSQRILKHRTLEIASARAWTELACHTQMRSTSKIKAFDFGDCGPGAPYILDDALEESPVGRPPVEP